MMKIAIEGEVSILEVDVDNYATSIGHSAAARVPAIMAVRTDSHYCWFNGCYPLIDADAEAAIQQLGSYVCNRTAQPGGEQLYRKAAELKLHSLDENGFASQPLWLRHAYRAFATMTFAAKCELQDAQDRARDEEELRRMAAPAVQPDEQPATVAPDAAEGGGVGAADIAAPPPPDPIAVAAQAAHEANRAYCQSIGDDSQVAWEDAPEWQRESATKGVVFAIDNGFPLPEAMHQSWCDEKIANGWIYGPEKDAEKKTHHCLVPYSDLPIDQRKKDDIFLATVKQSLLAQGVIEHDDVSHTETTLATAAASPEESMADTAGAGEPSPVPAAEPQQQKRKR